jgi:hypothetical protein
MRLPRSLVVINLAAVAVLVWGLLPGNPYGYFLILRLIICAASVYVAVAAHRARQEAWTWIFGGCALLYNPFVRVHLTREIWWVINLLTIVLFVSSLLVLRRVSKPRS